MSEEAKPEVTTEEQPAVTEQPPAETPATETPAAETPAAETPATETPAADTPAAETPAADTPAAETPAAETPAAEQPAAEEAPKTDDQPAVTEVTEVTEQPAATEEQGEAKKEEGEKKEEEKPKEEKKKEAKPKAVKPPVDYRTVKSGGVQKQGVIFKSFKHYFMTLDEDGSVLRWWKNEQRTSSDGALFMKFCAKVTEPTDEFTTNNWPAGTEDRRFVISSPHRAFYLVAENADERNDWIAKLTDAMNKYKEEGIKVITTNPMSVESFKASISKASDEAEYTLEKEGVTGKKTEETPKTEEEATPAAATEEPKAEEEAKPETEVKVEVEVETAATEEPPKTEEAAEKKEEEKPAEGEGGEESKTE